MRKPRVLYLPNADKYRGLTRRPSQEQKGLDERTRMASQRPFHPWLYPQSQPSGHTDPRISSRHPVVPSPALSSLRLRWLRPRRHAEQQHLAQRPDVLR
jgi:hypothetical protein